MRFDVYLVFSSKVGIPTKAITPNFMFAYKKKEPTATARRLAQKLWDFVRFTVNRVPDTKNPPQMLDDWARSFDRFSANVPLEKVDAVFDFYVKNWRLNKGWAHTTADSFLEDFTYLESRYERTCRPIPEEELQTVLKSLKIERWVCDWEDLVTAVSQSLFNLRAFLKKWDESGIPENVRRRVREYFGDTREYVTRHFLAWRDWNRTHVYTAVINNEYLLKEVRIRLTNYGIPAKIIADYLSAFS